MTTNWEKVKALRMEALKQGNHRFTKEAAQERARLAKRRGMLTVIKGCGIKTNYGKYITDGGLGCDIQDEFQACVNCRTSRRSPKCKQTREAQQVLGRPLKDGKLGDFETFVPEQMNLPVLILAVGNRDTAFGPDPHVEFEMMKVDATGKDGERVRAAYALNGRYADGVKHPTYMTPGSKNYGHGDFYNSY